MSAYVPLPACHHGQMAQDDGLAEGEYVVLRLHPHWKTVVRPVLLLAVIVAAVIAALVYLPRVTDQARVRLGIAVAAVLLAIAFCAVPFLRWRTTTYELTNHRLRLRSGILSRTGRDFPLARVSDVSFTQRLSDRVLGCGISVSTSWPCSPADSTTSEPQPRNRSDSRWENETSLTRASGKSRPARLRMPERSRSR
jgi:membrane protein YdbS with pleckstrin-like domain